MEALIKKYSYLILFVVLIFASFLIWYININQRGNSLDNERYVHRIEKKINAELKSSAQELQEISGLVYNSEKFDFSILEGKSKYPYFVYKNSKIVFWSDFRFVPEYESINKVSKKEYVSFKNGKYLVTRYSFKKKRERYDVFLCLPLENKYSIQNNYISSALNKDFFPYKGISINDFHMSAGYEVIAEDGQYLFSVDFPGNNYYKSDSLKFYLTFIILIGICFWFVFIMQCTLNLNNNGMIGLSILFFLLALVITRVILLSINYPFSLVEIDLFNPKYFASSSLAPSLGDFFINILFLSFFFWYVLNNYTKIDLIKKIIDGKRNLDLVYTILLVIISSFFIHYLEYTYRLLYSNSQWSLDITSSLDVNLFKVFCVIIFILSCGIYFICSHIIVRIFLAYINKPEMPVYMIIACTSLFIWVVGTFLNIVNTFVLILNVFYIFSLLIFRLPENLVRLKYATYIYFLLSAFVCALVGANTLYNYNIEKTVIEKNKYSTQLLAENDLFGEYLLYEASENISSDKFIKSKLKSIFSTKDIVEQKIKKIILPDYLNKYDAIVSVFDEEGNVYNQHAGYSSYQQALLLYSKEKNKTEFKNIYFLKGSGDSPLKRYISFIELYDQNYIIGYVIIELVHKKKSLNSVYPELLVDKKFIQPNQLKTYNYAIYEGDKILLTFGGFNYDKNITSQDLGNKLLYDNGIIKNGYHHLGIKSSDGKVLVISSEKYNLKNVFSNFSLLFLILILFVLLFVVAYAFYFKFNDIYVNYAAKIQIYLNIAFFLPLFIVSLTSLSLTSSNYRENLNKSYLVKAEKLREDIMSHLENYEDENSWEVKVENEIAQMAEYTDLDINLFDDAGALLYSYHPAIYNRGLLSKYINPEAYSSIIENKYDEILLPESVGKLKYNSVYVAIKSSTTNELLGVLSMPFFESKQEIDQQMISVLTTTLNIFSTIFILFIILSYFASKILTSPLQMITQIIRKTTFGGDNKPIKWKSKDEIGLLINEYNKMLENLKQSKDALSKSEKESAWREMAKQVAHEIKNPLTPMKLTIQHLQKGLKEKREGIEQHTEKGLQSLLNQVDILSEIASSFAVFAKLPIPKYEKFELCRLLRNTVNLYNNTHDVNVDISTDDGEFYVMGDQQLMGAIFTNLIINSIQSLPNDRKAKVEIKLSRIEAIVLIEIKDNGNGIPEHAMDKVFLPNFSTKDTGSGIGLAVAKRGVEHAGGKIWFKTVVNEGTSFFIELPLVM